MWHSNVIWNSLMEHFQHRKWLNSLQGRWKLVGGCYLVWWARETCVQAGWLSGEGEDSNGKCWIQWTGSAALFSEDHTCTGIFKGMAMIFKEHWFGDMSKKLAECKGLKCTPLTLIVVVISSYTTNLISSTSIPFSRLLARPGVCVLFLPKIHCDLKFIEQCWGFAKQISWLNPESSQEGQLEKNALASLNAVPLELMSDKTCQITSIHLLTFT